MTYIQRNAWALSGRLTTVGMSDSCPGSIMTSIPGTATLFHLEVAVSYRPSSDPKMEVVSERRILSSCLTISLDRRRQVRAAVSGHWGAMAACPVVWNMARPHPSEMRDFITRTFSATCKVRSRIGILPRRNEGSIYC